MAFDKFKEDFNKAKQEAQVYNQNAQLEKSVYCNQCKTISLPKLKGSGWITFLFLLVWIIPGLFYMVWRRSGLGVCGNCSSTNIIPAKNAPIANSYKPVGLEETVKQVNCSDCRELIRFDARKCKHCGSYTNQE